MRLDMEVKPVLCPAHRSLLPDGKQLILHSSTTLSQSLPCLFLDRGLYTPPPSLPYSLHSPFPGRISQKFGNPFPTAWEISLSIVVADIVFACLDLLQQKWKPLALADGPLHGARPEDERRNGSPGKRVSLRSHRLSRFVQTYSIRERKGSCAPWYPDPR